MENAINYHISRHFPILCMQLSNEKDYKHLLGSFEKIEGFEIVWFQKVSIPPPRRELEIPGGGGGVKSPGKSRGEGG